MIHTARQSPKFIKLVRRLRPIIAGRAFLDAESVAIVVLERLWHATATGAIRGDIGRFDNESIAEACGWPDDADELIQVLVECGWLDESEEHRLVVHDWHDHAPRYVKGNAKKAGGFVSQASAPKEEPYKAGPIEAGPHEVPPPNQTKPNLTKPNNTPCSPPRGTALSVQEFFDRWNRFAARNPKIASCRKLTPERRRKLKSRLSEPGWLADFEEAVKSLPLASDGWQPNLDWLIRNSSNVYRLLEGDFDWRNKDDPAAERLTKKRRENAFKQRQEHEARQKADRERTATHSRRTIESAVGQTSLSLLSEPPKPEKEKRTQREIEEALRNV